MEKIKVHIDEVGFKDKKTAEENFKSIKIRLQRDSAPVEVTIKELIEEIHQGKAISPAVMKGTKAEDFVEQQLFMVDIDNKSIPFLQVEEAISICEKNDLPVAFFYYTFSHTEEVPKYRLVFIMDEVVTDKVLRDTVTKKLISLFEQADTSCTNADRIFLGTDKEVIICDLESRITVDTILKIPFKSAIVKKKRTSRKDKELEELINNFDFLDYLKKRNGKIKRDTGTYAMFENCEICGHHDDLVYYYETNSFYCFSDDGNVGGSIIDYIMAVEHIDLKQAIEKFKKEICKMKKKLKLIRMSDVELKEVKWAWYPLIPAGKVTLLYGNPRRRQNSFFTSSCKYNYK